MTRSSEIDGFRLAYERHPAATTRSCCRTAGPATSVRSCRCCPTSNWSCPDLRGFGASDKHAADPAEPLGAKDLGLFTALGAANTVDTPPAALARDRYLAAAEAGFGEADVAAVVELLRG